MKPKMRLATLLCLVGSTGLALAATNHPISQRGRAFVPATVEIAVDEPLPIQNDDEFVHDLMVNSPDFDFDSGEQQVGQTVEIKFPRPGNYQVLCAIHPKMRLNVSVK